MKRNEIILPISRSSDLRGAGVFAEKALFSGENQVLVRKREKGTYRGWRKWYWYNQRKGFRSWRGVGDGRKGDIKN